MQQALANSMQEMTRLLKTVGLAEPTVLDAGLISYTEMEKATLVRNAEPGVDPGLSLTWQDVKAQALDWQANHRAGQDDQN